LADSIWRRRRGRNPRRGKLLRQRGKAAFLSNFFSNGVKEAQTFAVLKICFLLSKVGTSETSFGSQSRSKSSCLGCGAGTEGKELIERPASGVTENREGKEDEVKPIGMFLTGRMYQTQAEGSSLCTRHVIGRDEKGR